jgi:predicted dehydrogenase
MKLRVLVIGLGQIGMGYDLSKDPKEYVLTHARAFHLHPAFELVGGVDSDLNRLKLFEMTYSCPGYSNLSDALSSLLPDLVAVAVPTEFHYQVVQQILQYSSPIAILCEKPLEYDLNRGIALVNDCCARGIKLYVNYMRRSDRAMIKVKNLLLASSPSQPIKGVCWYSKGILNNGSHFLNLLQDWLGEITASQVIDRGYVVGVQDPEPDVKFDFALGSVVFLSAREEYFSHYTIELITQYGRLRYEEGGAKISWQSVMSDSICEGYQVLNPSDEVLSSDFNQIQWYVVDQLAANLSGVDANICSGQEALETLKVLSQIVRSL